MPRTLAAAIGVLLLAAGCTNSGTSPRASSRNDSVSISNTQTETRTTTAQRSVSVGKSAGDCAIEAEILSGSWQASSSFVDDFVSAAGRGDMAGAQSAYNSIKWLMADLPRMTRELANECGSYGPVADMRRGASDSERGWRDVQRICRSDLAPLGFDC